jgi:hypothetical protein
MEAVLKGRDYDVFLNKIADPPSIAYRGCDSIEVGFTTTNAIGTY